jgi:hypothetical protein
VTLDDLQPFCWPDNTRPRLQTPWTREGFTYATDGFICIRVPALPEVTRTDGPVAENTFQSLDMLSEADAIPLSAIAIPEPKPCETCDGGNRKEVDVDCEECDGAGISQEMQLVRIGDVGYQAALLRRLLTLPNVRITPDYPGPGRIFFDGGEGAIMPMRKVDSRPT